jgi:hypothetical protein
MVDLYIQNSPVAILPPHSRLNSDPNLNLLDHTNTTDSSPLGTESIGSSVTSYAFFHRSASGPLDTNGTSVSAVMNNHADNSGYEADTCSMVTRPLDMEGDDHTDSSSDDMIHGSWCLVLMICTGTNRYRIAPIPTLIVIPDRHAQTQSHRNRERQLPHTIRKTSKNLVLE